MTLISSSSIILPYIVLAGRPLVPLGSAFFLFPFPFRVSLSLGLRFLCISGVPFFEAPIPNHFVQIDASINYTTIDPRS